jgi:hypothetical protein
LILCTFPHNQRGVGTLGKLTGISGGLNKRLVHQLQKPLEVRAI